MKYYIKKSRDADKNRRMAGRQRSAARRELKTEAPWEEVWNEI